MTETTRWASSDALRTTTALIRRDDVPLTTRLNEAYRRDEFAQKAVLTSALNGLYAFRGGSIVEGFLAENPALSDLLFEAHREVSGHFGPGVEMALEVVADPEALGDRQLFVLVRTELPRREARTRLAELDRDWWLDALPAAGGKMEIALE